LYRVQIQADCRRVGRFLASSTTQLAPKPENKNSRAWGIPVWYQLNYTTLAVAEKSTVLSTASSKTIQCWVLSLSAQDIGSQKGPKSDRNDRVWRLFAGPKDEGKCVCIFFPQWVDRVAVWSVKRWMTLTLMEFNDIGCAAYELDALLLWNAANIHNAHTLNLHQQSSYVSLI